MTQFITLWQLSFLGGNQENQKKKTAKKSREKKNKVKNTQARQKQEIKKEMWAEKGARGQQSV